MKLTVLVLFGGTSSEYPVSLQSAAAVIEGIDTARYEVLCAGITQSGQWLLYPGPAGNIRTDSWFTHPGCVPVVLSASREDHGLWLMHEAGAQLRTVDIVFPVLHGRGGEDGCLQGLLELSGIPFVGCSCLTSALCMDKALAHEVAQNAGIACPRFTVTFEEDAEQVLHAMRGIPLPWFVKPACEGSSFGITRVERVSELPLALHTAFRFGSKVVVEQAIEGFEVGCAVLGNGEVTIGEVDAIALQKGFFDYHEKYNLETAQILLPAPVSAEKREEIRATALKLYRLMGCRGFARVDMFLTPAGEIVFNEINTIPGLTAHSRYPGMLGAIGIGFEAMVQKLLELAVEPQ